SSGGARGRTVGDRCGPTAWGRVHPPRSSSAEAQPSERPYGEEDALRLLVETLLAHRLGLCPLDDLEKAVVGPVSEAGGSIVILGEGDRQVTGELPRKRIDEQRVKQRRGLDARGVDDLRILLVGE